MKKLLFVLAILLLPSLAGAQREAPAIVSSARPAAPLTNADLSTTPVFSPVVNVAGYSLALIRTDFDGSGDATDVSYFCEESDNGTSGWSEITKVAADDAVTLFNPTRTTSVSVVFTIRLDVTGFQNVRCTYTGTGATSADKVSVTVRLIRGI